MPQVAATCNCRAKKGLQLFLEDPPPHYLRDPLPVPPSKLFRLRSGYA